MGFTRASVLLTLVCAVLDCTSQVQPGPLRVDPTGENNAVQLSTTDSASEAVLAKFFRSPADQAFRPYSLLLTNSSDKPIIGLTLVWTVTTPEYVRKYEDHFETLHGAILSPNFAPAPPTPEELAAQRAARRAAMRAAVTSGGTPASQPRVQIARSGASFPQSLAPGKSMMVAPNRFSFADGPVSGGGPAQVFASATDISVSVDAVVLADGQVLGPDQTGTLSALNSRNAAFEALLTAVRSAREKGEDPIPILERFADPSRRRESVTARDEVTMANFLLHSPNWEKQIEGMEKAEPDLVSYHK